MTIYDLNKYCVKGDLQTVKDSLKKFKYEIHHIFQLTLLACSYNKEQIVKYILENHITSEDINYYSLFSSACYDQSLDVMEYLIKHKNIDVTHGSCEMFRQACEYGKYNTAEFLIHHPKIDPTVEYNYALRNAYLNYHTDIVDLLLNDVHVLRSIDSRILNFLPDLKNDIIRIHKIDSKDFKKFMKII
jgi:hypothetical protein